MKRTITIILITLLIAALSITSYAYTVTDYNMITENLTAVCGNDGMYMLGWSGTRLSVERIAPSPTGASLSLSNNIASASIYRGDLTALCNDVANDQMIVYTYDIEKDFLDSFAINGVKAQNDCGFCFDGSWLYMKDSANDRLIDRYSTSGVLSGSYSLPGVIGQIFSGWNGGVYAVCGGALYKCSSYGCYPVGGSSISVPASFISGDLLCDSRGKVYLVGSSLDYLFTVDSGVTCAAGDSLYSASSGVIYRYDMNGHKLSYAEIDDNITALYYGSGSVCAFSLTAKVSWLSPAEFNVMPAPDNNSASTDKPISSELYKVDYSTYRISGIPAGTTFAQFKKNMSYTGYTAELYRGSRGITSGDVGTAMTVIFNSEQSSYTFELSVAGDITGEGNVNSRDVGMLMDYLIGSAAYDGVYLLSSDVSSDGNVDVMDLAILCRMYK